jgi:oxygen-independent coproporphyrinogen-3 oxidase
MKKKDAMLAALQQELLLRKDEFTGQVVETIYFGGGTPSVLRAAEINELIRTVYAHYEVHAAPEITIEANPDDLSTSKLKELAASPVNRLSIGIQSFFDEDLSLMNRAHSAVQAMESLREATQLFNNISIDLIYGLPYLEHDRWKKNIAIALEFNVAHISSYALTVEPKTALKKFIEKGVVPPIDDDMAEEQFHILIDMLTEAGYQHYELSNFGKPSFFSKNNTAYWLGKNYMGIGPSAHSYDGKRRGWNSRNNSVYIKSIEQQKLPMEIEILTKVDRYNEYVMTGLRTIWGVSLQKVMSDFGTKYYEYLLQQSEKNREDGFLRIDGDTLLVTKKGKFLSDGLAADLFMLNLEGNSKVQT